MSNSAVTPTAFFYTTLAATDYTTATTWTFNSAGGTSASVTLRYTKIGNVVTLYIPGVTATSGTGSTEFASNTAIDTAARPIRAIDTQCFVTNNNTAIASPMGRLTLGTNGLFLFNRDLNGTSFTNSSNCGINAAVLISYIVN